MKRPQSLTSHISFQEKRILLAKLLQQKANKIKRFPASFAQERLWFLDQLLQDKPVYNVPLMLRLRGRLDVGVLERSINEIVHRHEALRTTFKIVDEQLYQVIHPELTIPLMKMDLCDLPANTIDIESERLVIEEARRPFDLLEGPLLRTHLWKLDTKEFILLINMHHIITDEWSLGVFFHELSSIYGAFLQNTPLPLPELPIQFADYTFWQRDTLHDAELNRQLVYWKDRLAKCPVVLELPTDRSRPPVQSHQGSVHRFSLPVNLSRELKDFSHQEGVTLFVTLLTAFCVFLYRYSGQTDFCIGTPITNRSRVELESLIGFFLNTLALRVNVAGNTTFRDVLRHVQDVCLEAYDHQELPFEKLVEELKVARSMSYTPLFQVMFVLQRDLESQVRLPELEVDVKGINPGVAKFDVTLVMVETASGGLRGWWEYASDLFDKTTFETWTAHFQIMLEGIIANPTHALSMLPLLSINQRHQQLEEWNNTNVDYTKDRCVHELFEEQVNRTPDAVAAVCGNQQLTYRELNVRANQLAHYLQKRGVAPGVLVGICVGQSLEMIVGLLGILKAGGAYVPIDPMYPKDRIDFMLKDAQCSVILTQEHFYINLPPQMGDVVLLDAHWSQIGQENGNNPVGNTMHSDLIYVIYTSGTTGRPKGSGVYHQGFTNLLNWFIQDFQLNASDHVLIVSSLSFDLTQKNLYTPLIIGGELHLRPLEYYDPEEIVQIVYESKITWINCAPSAFYPLVVYGDKSVLMKQTLRYVFLGGEPISLSRLSEWIDASPQGTEIVNTYGPTECTDISTSYRISSGTRSSDTGVPIGKPIFNVQVYILDENQQVLPVGRVGELYIGGRGVGPGYINDSSLTLQKFVPNPYAKDTKERMYRTGDIVRFLPDGNIIFLGRNDHQVKIRGFRIELGEIETALTEHPGVKEATIVVHEGHFGDKQLIAYFVPEEGLYPAIGDLRHYLIERLPEYMVPSAFLVLDALPLTPNGKVDRKALMGQNVEFTSEKEFEDPRTPVEQMLADIWREVLGLKEVGIHDNFFDLGGDSILSIQMISKARKGGLQLTPKQVFLYQNIAELAMSVSVRPTLQSERRPVAGLLPLLPSQSFLLEAEYFDPNQLNTYALFDVQRPWNKSWWEPVLQQLLLHHDALRSRFVRGANGWIQSISPLSGVIPFSYIDLSRLPEKKKSMALVRVGRRLQKSLNLADGPIIRVAYFDLGPKKNGRLLIIVHHLAFDGVSWNILMGDLGTAWQQLRDGSPIQFAPNTTSLKEWTERLNEFCQSEELQQELAFWISERWAKAKPLPVDFPEGRINNIGGSARSVHLSLSVLETKYLLDESRAHHDQVLEILLAALTVVFARWSGTRNLLVRLVGNGRVPPLDGIDFSHTVGFLAQLHPVLLDIERANTIGDVMKLVKEQLNNTPNGGFSYGILRYTSDDMNTVKKLEALPQPEVLFNYMGRVGQSGQSSVFRNLDQPVIGSNWSSSPKRDHLLDITIFIKNGQLEIEFEYSDKVHERSTIERLVQHFVQVIRSVYKKSTDNWDNDF